MRAGVLIVAALVLATSGTSRAAGSDPQTLFEQGNQAYLKGDYPVAARAYAQVLTEHQLDDPALYLNLGNVYFRLEKYGSAIFFFRRGLRLDPDDSLGERLDRNLKATRRKLQERYRASGDSKAFIYTEPGGLLFRVTHIFGPVTTVTFFLLFWSVFLGLLAWRRLRQVPSFVGPLTSGMAILALLTGMSVWGQAYTDESYRLGVVIERDVTLKQGRHPDAKGEALREGVEVRIVESDDEWVRVRRSDGAEGWVEVRAVKQI